jgi:hypothetical protein
VRTILHRVLAGPTEVPPLTDLAAWWARHRHAARGFKSPIEQAIAGGFAADRMGYAFASGYVSALRALVPSAPAEQIAVLCATERGGAHPRAIETSLHSSGDGRLLLSGRKRWTTLASQAEVLLVVAVANITESGRKRLRLVRVGAHAPGVTVTPMPAPPFAPEIEHAEVSLDEVAVAPADVLPGDGYDDYLKPFRTLEDCHVHAAALAYVLRVARQYEWPRGFAEQLAGLLVAVRALAGQDPRSPEVHVALSGVLQSSRRLLDSGSGYWERVEPEVRARWERDLALFAVAEGARAQRAERAWERLAGAGG